MIKIFEYARCSLSDPAAMTASLAGQLDTIARVSTSRGYSVQRTFIDFCSGNSHKTELDRLLNLAVVERPDAVVTADASRLARSSADLFKLRDELDDLGVRLIYAAEVEPHCPERASAQ